MKIKYLIVSAALFSLLFASCNKNHYDVTHVHGVNGGGELLLPVASASFTVADMMERFELTDMVNWTESGDMSLSFSYESDGVIKGSELLKFNDMNHSWHESFVNPLPITLPYGIDTVVRFQQRVDFQSDNIRVKQAEMKSGRFEFTVASNMGNMQHVVLHSSSIKDADGNDFLLDVPVMGNTFSFDLAGLNYDSDIPNAVDFDAEILFRFTGSQDATLYYDVNLTGRDLLIREMRGYVDAYSSHNYIDTTFTIFPNHLEGLMGVEGVKVSISERNTFGIGAHLIVDTAMMYNDGMAPYSIFDPLPLTVNIPPQEQLGEVFNQLVNGRINVYGGRVYLASTFVVNPDGLSQLVSVSDESVIDTQIDVELPFSFKLDDIRYIDTLDLDLSSIGMPEMIERLTMELAFASTMPLNLRASYYTYDSESGRITDTLLANSELIAASFDGSPKTTEVALVVDENRIDNVMHSDRIIMSCKLDTEKNNVKLNAKQKIDLSLKVKAEYNIDVEF